MAEIKFYEISQDNIGQVIAPLLYKIYDMTRKNIILLTEQESDVANYDKLLWVFSSNKFLPHGTDQDQENIYQPLLITAHEDNLNKAEIMVALRKPHTDFLQEFTQQIFIFSSDNKELFQDHIAQLKQQNIDFAYWKQDHNGKWQK